MTKHKWHTHFTLNGHSFESVDDLLQYAKPFELYSFLCDWFSNEDVVTVNTSGSTGVPKPITIKKQCMIHSAKATGAFFNLPENTTALLCLSTKYIAGKMMLVRALTLGWQLDVMLPTSTINLKKNYDFVAMVPLQLRNSLTTVDKIKKLIIGGGVVAPDLMDTIQQLPTHIFATYGMTETLTHIAVKKLNQFSSNRSPQFKNTAYYHTLPGVTIYVDQRNCLCIKAPDITDNFIVTNDVVQLVSDTQFEWLGRYDHVINSGAIKLHPEKIEEKLSKVINKRFFLAGVPDTVLGEKLVLVVEGRPQTTDLDEVGLSAYEYPKETYFLNEFVETETKKIQRKQTLLKALAK